MVPGALGSCHGTWGSRAAQDMVAFDLVFVAVWVANTVMPQRYTASGGGVVVPCTENQSQSQEQALKVVQQSHRVGKITQGQCNIEKDAAGRSMNDTHRRVTHPCVAW